MPKSRKRASTTRDARAGGAVKSPSFAEPRKAPDPGQYLTFRIGGEIYAVPVLETSEVLGYQESTPVPGAASWIYGLLNIRGKAIPVIDLATKFGARERAPIDSSCIIVLEVVLDEEPAQVGLIADDMPSVVAVEGDQISDPPLFGTLVHARYLRGMARLGAGLVLILDAVGALSAEDVAQLLDLEATAPGDGERSEDRGEGREARAGD
ncbi:MAG TPA: chemotaxis protein CheW [Thermoanaerobaculia bacterium]|nr:chemotaxis protein CheW [Thermoanaerobaculia bacterium]